MKQIPTWAERSSFHYEGSVANGTKIKLDSNITVNVKAEQFQALLNHFRGIPVNIGTSRTQPPAGSVGEWLIENVSKGNLASYVGAIVEEGYAARLGGAIIKFN